MRSPARLPDTERDRRWSEIRKLMRQADVGVVVAHSDLGDIRCFQRYISGYRSNFDEVASLLFDDNGTLVVSFAPTVNQARQLSWMDTVVTASATQSWIIGQGVAGQSIGLGRMGAEIGRLIAERGITRIGVADLELFPGGWRASIAEAIPGCEFVDLETALNQLRIVKAPPEIESIRTACQVGDEVWRQLPDIVKVGRREYEVLADVEHIIRSAGCEDSFSLFLPLPMFVHPMNAYPSSRRIEPGDAFNLEVSPRFNGYYGQLTGLVTVGDFDPAMVDAYESIVRAKDAGVARMKPGADITEVAHAAADQFAAEGRQISSLHIGHFCGLELEELRAGATPFTLTEGMTFVFHPHVVGWPALMRADTYLVTAEGAERLNSNSFRPTHL